MNCENFEMFFDRYFLSDAVRCSIMCSSVMNTDIKECVLTILVNQDSNNFKKQISQTEIGLAQIEYASQAFID